VGFGNSRNKVIIKQRIETAGKAGDRVAAAEAARRVAEAMYYQRRSEIQAEAAGLFDSIAFTRREIDIRKRISAHRAELFRLAKDLNRSGRLADQDLIDFEVAMAQSESDLLRAEEREHELVAGLESLLSLPPGSVAGCRDRDVEWEPAGWEAASADILSGNPGLVRLDRAVAAAVAARDLAESGAWSDVTVGLGYIRGFNFEMARDDFAMAFVEMPLPLVDRNQGAVQSAEAAVRRSERELEAAAGAALDKWQGLRRRWDAAAENRALHAERIAPGLERSRDIVRESVAAGRLPPQEEVEAALKVEAETLRILELDRDLATMRVVMIELTGREQL
jgi:cobalt-zinc-cadmium efflux system outer membrane protein